MRWRKDCLRGPSISSRPFLAQEVLFFLLTGSGLASWKELAESAPLKSPLRLSINSMKSSFCLYVISTTSRDKELVYPFLWELDRHMWRVYMHAIEAFAEERSRLCYRTCLRWYNYLLIVIPLRDVNVHGFIPSQWLVLLAFVIIFHESFIRDKWLSRIIVQWDENGCDIAFDLKLDACISVKFQNNNEGTFAVKLQVLLAGLARLVRKGFRKRQSSRHVLTESRNWKRLRGNETGKRRKDDSRHVGFEAGCM